MLSKKGSMFIISKNMVLSFIVIMLIMMILILLNSITYLFGRAVFDNFKSVKEYSYVHRVLYSPYCFTYEDPETSRAYPGIIDYNRLKEPNFRNCLIETPSSSEALAFKLMYGNNEMADFTTKVTPPRKNYELYIRYLLVHSNKGLLPVKGEVKVKV